MQENSAVRTVTIDDLLDVCRSSADRTVRQTAEHLISQENVVRLREDVAARMAHPDSELPIETLVQMRRSVIVDGSDRTLRAADSALRAIGICNDFDPDQSDAALVQELRRSDRKFPALTGRTRCGRAILVQINRNQLTIQISHVPGANAEDAIVLLREGYEHGRQLPSYVMVEALREFVHVPTTVAAPLKAADRW